VDRAKRRESARSFTREAEEERREDAIPKSQNLKDKVWKRASFLRYMLSTPQV
jgi:hypothetical protein